MTTDTSGIDPIAAAWHPAGWARDIGGGPHTLTLVGRELVVFRVAVGTAVTVPAACPHRGTHLGLGSVVDGQIRCPYHAWSFDGAGRCTRIPSLAADGRIPAGAHTVTLRPARPPRPPVGPATTRWPTPAPDPPAGRRCVRCRPTAAPCLR